MKHLLTRLARKPTLLMELIASTFFINILTLATPFFFILVFNRYLTGGVDGTLITLTAGMLIALSIQFAFRTIRARMAGEIGIQPDEELVKSVYEALTRARLEVFTRIKKAKIVQAANGLQVMQNAYSAPNVNSVLDMPFAFVFIGVIFLLNFQLGVVAFLGALLTLASAWAAMYSTKTTMSLQQGVSAGNQVLVSSIINSPETMRAFNASNHMRPRWSDQLKDMICLRRFNAHNEDISQSRLMSIGLLTRTFIIALGARQVVMGELTIGALIGISILSSMPLNILSRFVRTLSVLSRAREAGNLLEEFVKLPKEKLSGSALKSYSGAIEFRDLSFVYPGSKNPLFESLSVKAEPGQAIGITGFNGSGKSSLAKIAAGLMEPSRGGVLVDSIEMGQVSLSWWRSQIIYLPQEPGFVQASIRDNIMVARPDMDNETLNQILFMTGLRRFLDTHPQGLDLELSETGNPLSLGIRRRVALARALTTGGRLAILDEPGEGMDVEGLKMISKLIRQFKNQKKTVMVFSGEPRLLMDVEIIVDLGQKPLPKVMTMGQRTDVQ